MQENIVQDVNLRLLNKVLLVLRQKKAGKCLIRDFEEFIWEFKACSESFRAAYPEIDPKNPGYQWRPKIWPKSV